LQIKQGGALSELTVHNNGNLSIALPERINVDKTENNSQGPLPSSPELQLQI
jgi:hypothetical protein